MINLPEVEIIRRDLERDIVGKKIKTAEVNVPKIVKRHGTRAKFSSALVGRKIDSTERIGTLILITMDDESILVMNLGETGLVRRTPNKEKMASETVVVIGFTQHGQMRIVDSSKGASLFVLPSRESFEEDLPEVAALGMDPLANPMSWTDFGRAVLGTSPPQKLKTLLTDNSFVVGLGNVYSDEVLFSAGLRYDRMSNDLNTQELRRFYRGLVETMYDSVKYRGTSTEAAPFVDIAGESGVYQDHLQVYGRHGALSPRTRRPISRTKFAGNWTYFCEDSQV